jgi:hypothetical protein
MWRLNLREIKKIFLKILKNEKKSEQDQDAQTYCKTFTLCLIKDKIPLKCDFKSIRFRFFLLIIGGK